MFETFLKWIIMSTVYEATTIKKKGEKIALLDRYLDICIWRDFLCCSIFTSNNNKHNDDDN